jgi:hypothetical protein
MSKRRSSRSRSRRVTKKETPSEPVDLAKEYAYVIEDLKRIGMIAGALIAGLVVLSFFI